MNLQDKEYVKWLQRARSLIDSGLTIESLLASNFIPKNYAEAIESELKKEGNLVVETVRVITANKTAVDWTLGLDRSNWYYWPTLRQFLLTIKKWKSLKSLEDASDRIFKLIGSPERENFDVRGLVLGYVQSGKTANYTAVIAKAADVGYRLIVVLAGVDNSLRKQTNSRLKRELVGYSDNRAGAVRIPIEGRIWHEFTSDTINGDFNPGLVTYAALQGPQPVLMVIKKNGDVLRRLLAWLGHAPINLIKTVPMLVIDDEADQASVDTKGSYQTEDGPPDDPDYEPPSVINGLIRDLLQKFPRRAYVAYTATPFANILIPHDTIDPKVGNDLYPKDFIVDLPKPEGYTGAEEFFGRMDPSTDDNVQGLDVVRQVTDKDIELLEQGKIPESLANAITDFVLAGAARAERGDGNEPATMLIHTSQLIVVQAQLKRHVDEHFAELKAEWRYQRRQGLRDRLIKRWDDKFRHIIRSFNLEKDTTFDKIEPFLGVFLDAVQVKEINSLTGEVLDYEREPSLKAIAVGGNRLSRGLTLEGLLVSFFVRRSKNYDTLMQMGRWFGFRAGYADLTRICMTTEVESWFSDLSLVEYRLRQDIQIYEKEGLTPYEVGLRIWQHSTMQVTSPLKRRFTTDTVISQTYSLQNAQIYRFPLSNLNVLNKQSDDNAKLVINYIPQFGSPNANLPDKQGPIWTGVDPKIILSFLAGYSTVSGASGVSLPLIIEYIVRALNVGELLNWTVAIRGRGKVHEKLGSVDWGVPTGKIAQISRTRLGNTDSLGVIIDPEDEAIGLETKEEGRYARIKRPPEQGLLLLYPISRYSGYDVPTKGRRRPIFEQPSSEAACDLIGLGISFPKARKPQRLEAYLVGTAGWKLST